MKKSLSKKLAALPSDLQDWLEELPLEDLIALLHAERESYLLQASAPPLDDFRQYLVGEPDVPYGLPTPGKTPTLGAWRGKIWLSDDFDAPLEGFEDYRP